MSDIKNRISILWVMTMLGITIHTCFDLLPLFFGGSVAMENSTGTVPAYMGIMMATISYTIPFIGMLFWLYGKKRCHLVTSLIIAIFLSILNIIHMGELFTGASITQFFIMPLNAAVAILLVFDLWKVQKSMK